MSTTLAPITVGTPTDPGLPVQVGALVVYNGRLRHERGNVFYVSAVDEFPGHRYDAYELTDRDYPAVTVLRNVGRSSFTPTGATIVFCGCGHEAGNLSVTPWCAALCGCELHDFERTD